MAASYERSMVVHRVRPVAIYGSMAWWVAPHVGALLGFCCPNKRTVYQICTLSCAVLSDSRNPDAGQRILCTRYQNDFGQPATLDVSWIFTWPQDCQSRRNGKLAICCKVTTSNFSPTDQNWALQLEPSFSQIYATYLNHTVFQRIRAESNFDAKGWSTNEV